MANPFVAAEVTSSAEVDLLPLYKEYAWNFDTDNFIYDADGNHKIVTENEALKVWIYKALKTERYRYRAYMDDYGEELEQFIGKKPNDAETASEMEKYIKEGLMVNPYIKRIDSIDVTVQQHDEIELTIELTTIYGSMVTSVTV
jgi:hypothetical protein